MHDTKLCAAYPARPMKLHMWMFCDLSEHGRRTRRSTDSPQDQQSTTWGRRILVPARAKGPALARMVVSPHADMYRHVAIVIVAEISRSRLAPCG